MATRINELNLDEETMDSLLQSLCDNDPSSSSSSDSEEGIQVNDLEYTSSSSDENCCDINVLTNEEEQILQRLDHASDNEK